jgi:hypothetical protein
MGLPNPAGILVEGPLKFHQYIDHNRLLQLQRDPALHTGGRVAGGFRLMAVALFVVPHKLLTCLEFLFIP